jgi:hypothetical protein
MLQPDHSLHPSLRIRKPGSRGSVTASELRTECRSIPPVSAVTIHFLSGKGRTGQLLSIGLTRKEKGQNFSGVTRATYA